MRSVAVVVCCIFLLLFSFLSLNAGPSVVRSKTLTVLGTLTEDTSVGTESTGWSIKLNPVIMVDGKQITCLEIKSTDTHKLVPLEDKFVQARGKLTFVSGGETTQPPTFELSWIKEHKPRSLEP